MVVQSSRMNSQLLCDPGSFPSNAQSGYGVVAGCRGRGTPCLAPRGCSHYCPRGSSVAMICCFHDLELLVRLDGTFVRLLIVAGGGFGARTR